MCARLLAERGWPVEVSLLGERNGLKGDARSASGLWEGEVVPFDVFPPEADALVIDALFGAGLNRPLRETIRTRLAAHYEAASAVIAVDLPSGLNGDARAGFDAVGSVDLTVSFHRPKPAHRLQPAARVCGEVVIAPIGIPDGWQAEIGPTALENREESFWSLLPARHTDTHKHRRGRLVVVSGGALKTGAARLAARAGLAIGAGLVTLAGEAEALAVHAAQETAIMLVELPEAASTRSVLGTTRATTCVIGPAGGVAEPMRTAVGQLLGSDASAILDADALTSFQDDPERLFAALRPRDVLTPHVGEFERLFPGELERSVNRIEAVRRAADRAGCVVLLKGPDTVIAAPGEVPVVNTHASPALATAGSGDVLAGLIGGLIAQGMAGFDAACLAAWLHGDAGIRLGGPLTAEALPAAAADSLARLYRMQTQRLALAKLAWS